MDIGGIVVEAQIPSSSELIEARSKLPNIPAFAGQDSFKGTSFHSASWNHEIDLSGKSVAVIGNAASAVQFVPPVAEEAGSLSIYQRSPNWLAQKLDRPYTDREKALMHRFQEQ